MDALTANDASLAEAFGKGGQNGNADGDDDEEQEANEDGQLLRGEGNGND